MFITSTSDCWWLQKSSCTVSIDTLRLRQSGCHLPDGILKCIFLNENIRISIKNPLKFVPKGPINNIPALVQIMAWCHSGDKPLSETILVILPTHICVTWPQWFNLWNQLVTARNTQKQIHLWYMASTGCVWSVDCKKIAHEKIHTLHLNCGFLALQIPPKHCQGPDWYCVLCLRRVNEVWQRFC